VPHWSNPDRQLVAIADENGDFTTSFVVDQRDLNTTFYVLAVGVPSGKTAETTFTDAGPKYVAAVSGSPLTGARQPTRRDGRSAEPTRGPQPARRSSAARQLAEPVVGSGRGRWRVAAHRSG
jgi:hypothetical protein